MLRLISIIGIAIAMVIGFVAISTKMKDDYTVRSRVVEVLKQMKDIATTELACDKPVETESPAPETAGLTETEVSPGVQMETLKNSQSENRSSTENEPSSEPDADQQQTNAVSSREQPATGESDSDRTEQTAVARSPDEDELESRKVTQNSDIIKTMGYRILNSGDVEVVVIFSDVYGDSGKSYINSGSRIVIHCSCASTEISCKTAESNINKNYLPLSLTKQ